MAECSVEFHDSSIDLLSIYVCVFDKSDESNAGLLRRPPRAVLRPRGEVADRHPEEGQRLRE